MDTRAPAKVAHRRAGRRECRLRDKQSARPSGLVSGPTLAGGSVPNRVQAVQEGLDIVLYRDCGGDTTVTQLDRNSPAKRSRTDSYGRKLS